MHMRQKQHETSLHLISGKLYFQFRHVSCYASSMQIDGKPVQKKIGKKNEVVSLLKRRRQRVNKIIIFLGQKFKSWQRRSSSSSVEAGFHVISLVVSITRVVLNVFRRSRPSYGNAPNERDTIPAMGPLQLNGRVRQKRLPREYGRQWGKKKTRLHHLKFDFPFFKVDTTTRLSLLQGVLYHVTVKMPSASWSDRASKGPLG